MKIPLLQAFLQRIVNGGGRINREYALGRKYTDLVLEWPLDDDKGFYGEVQRVVLELKILRGGLGFCQFYAENFRRSTCWPVGSCSFSSIYSKPYFE